MSCSASLIDAEPPEKQMDCEQPLVPQWRQNMANNLISRPCISPRQLCFWVFVSVAVYPQILRHIQMPTDPILEAFGGGGLMLAIAAFAAILATIEAKYFRRGSAAS
jgi:hypothetical protein